LDFKIVIIIRKAQERIAVSICLSEHNGAEQKRLSTVQVYNENRPTIWLPPIKIRYVKF